MLHFHSPSCYQLSYDGRGRILGLGLGETAGAVLDEVLGGDFDELGGGVGEALLGIAQGVAGLEGAASWRRGENGGQALNGVELFAFDLAGWDAAQEGAGVGVARMGKEGGSGCAFHNASGVHDIDVVAGLGDDGEVVGDEDDGGTQVLLAFADEVEDLLLDGDVEGGGGLVGDEKLGLGDEGHRDHDSLAHAAREFVGIAIDAGFGVGDADFGESLDGAGASGIALDTKVESEGFGELVDNLEVGIERGHGVLEDHRDPFAADGAQVFLVFGQEINAIKEGFAGVDFSRGLGNEAQKGITGDGFAGTGFADDAEGFSSFDRKGDILHRVDDAVAGVKAGGEI